MAVAGTAVETVAFCVPLSQSLSVGGKGTVIGGEQCLRRPVDEIDPSVLPQKLHVFLPKYSTVAGGYDAVLTGVEARSSSPVRMLRDENMEAWIKGLYPCGEGAGYAGGITSAAVDGIKVAEKILAKQS